MPAPQVMTVTGPMPASALGVVDAHDHLFLRSPALAGHEFDDLDRSTDEVRGAAAAGIGAIVEMTPIGCGRRPDLMRRLSGASGVPVIAATGYHRDAHYPPGHPVHELSVEELTRRCIVDLVDGMHPSDWDDPAAALDDARAGAIKAGASYQHVSASERRRLEAVARANGETDAAILVHTEVGTCGHEIVDLLTSAGVNTGRIILSHLDRNPDAELHAELAGRGVWLEYDTVGRIKYRPDSTLLDLIAVLVGAGFGDRIMLGMDLGRRDYLRAYGGGPGIAYLMTDFVPRLRRRVGDAAAHAILATNPAAAFAIPAA